MPWPGDADVLVWVARAPARPRQAHLALLDERERAAGAARIRPADRARHACAHALARTVLGLCLDLDPRELEWAPGDRGRPALAGSGAARHPQVDFNLATTPGLVACAVARGGRVGVDLQAPLPGLDPGGVARRCFSAPERAWLRSAQHRAAAFCRIWTLKEAVAKADGRGLGLPLQAISLVPGAAGNIDADFGALGAAGWRLMGALAGDVPVGLATRGVAGAIAWKPPPPGPDFATVALRVRDRHPSTETPPA